MSTEIVPAHVDGLIREGRTRLMAGGPRKNLWAFSMRLLEAVGSLWAGNRYLYSRYEEAKRENADLYRLLCALAQQNGGYLRLNRATWEAVNADRRLRGFAIEGSDDTLLQVTTQELVVSPAPTWIVPALEGRIPFGGPTKLPELMKGDPIFAPAFEVDDYRRRLTPVGSASNDQKGE